ncbi:Non-canonical non-ribosomal peptide synthetase [Lachnellula subtilissima]|uniref:Non-canonical non-ribosomal peptide synthetase n=1 Tax=Lachnellula subtilissima TaxID=602034 RepID=A0A8H8UHY1_9HELO|nr:Non-canonical non-ribosomal peptide synthetase [Lachnellula subtilissima]
MDEDQMLLPTLIDEIAQAEPERLYCAFLRTTDINDGVVKVSYSAFSNAVNRLSWFLEKTFGRSDDFTTLGYIGPSDIRYAIITLAAVKTGHKAFLMSQVNPVPAQLRLLEDTKCDHLLVARDFPVFSPVLDAIASHRQVNIVDIESVDHWIAKDRVEKYCFTATLSSNPRRPFVVLHTSGSTGFPGHIVYHFGALTAYRHWTAPRDLIPNAPKTIQEIWQNNCIYMTLPAAHMIGLLHMTVAAVYWNMPPILGPPNVFPTPDMACSIISLDFCQAAAMPPVLLQGMARSEKHLDALRRLDHVSWIGGAFSSSTIADKIRSYVTLIGGYGSTESGGLPLDFIDQSDYEWMSFSPIVGARFDPYAEDLYEFVIEKDDRILPAQFVFLNWPELSEWHTRDLFSKHPTKEGLWKFQGRADDMFSMLNGAKYNPLAMETIVAAHPQVMTALLVGEARERTIWLLEVYNPPQNDQEKRKLVDEIWPTVEEANGIAQLPSRVTSKNAVVFSQKGKPFPRAGKGSVQRKLAIRAYQEEIDACIV